MDIIDLLWVSVASLVAGTVYGFAGFGSALIFLPLATMVVSPVVAIASLSISAISSFVTLVPTAWREADRKAASIMLGMALLFIPLGIWVLRTSDPTAIRWAVSIIAAITLAALIAGWRYKTTPGLASWIGVGAGVGFLGGATGLNGPILILFQLGGQDQIARTRANTIIVLTCSGLSYLPFMAMQGLVTTQSLLLGLSQLIPYGVGAFIGRRLFNPAQTQLYRGVAYVIIGVSVLMGLPIWEG